MTSVSVMYAVNAPAGQRARGNCVLHAQVAMAQGSEDRACGDRQIEMGARPATRSALGMASVLPMIVGWTS